LYGVVGGIAETEMISDKEFPNLRP